MTLFTLSNVMFGEASDPIAISDGAVRIEKLTLNTVTLDAVGLPVNPVKFRTRVFDLVDPDTKSRWVGCMFSAWEKAVLVGNTAIVLTGVDILFTKWIECPESPHSRE